MKIYCSTASAFLAMMVLMTASTNHNFASAAGVRGSRSATESKRLLKQNKGGHKSGSGGQAAQGSAPYNTELASTDLSTASVSSVQVTNSNGQSTQVSNGGTSTPVNPPASASTTPSSSNTQVVNAQVNNGASSQGSASPPASSSTNPSSSNTMVVGGSVTVTQSDPASDRTDTTGGAAVDVFDVMEQYVGAPHADSVAGYNFGANGEEVGGDAAVVGIKVTNSNGVVTHETGSVDRADTTASTNYVNPYSVSNNAKSGKKKGGMMRRARL